MVYIQTTHPHGVLRGYCTVLPRHWNAQPIFTMSLGIQGNRIGKKIKIKIKHNTIPVLPLDHTLSLSPCLSSPVSHHVFQVRNTIHNRTHLATLLCHFYILSFSALLLSLSCYVRVAWIAWTGPTGNLIACCSRGRSFPNNREDSRLYDNYVNNAINSTFRD